MADLHEIGDRIDADKRVEFNGISDASDFDVPGTDVVYVHFTERNEWSFARG